MSSRSHFACILAGLLGTAGSAVATDPVWINNGTITIPPQIDAVTFINNGLMNILTTEPFETANTLYYTNKGSMYGDVGWRFSLNPSVTGVPRFSHTFHNRMGGVISSSSSIIYITPNGYEIPNYIYADATNFVNRGILSIEAGGEMVLNGVNMDLSRGGTGVDPLFGVGSINISNYFLPDIAIDDLWWGQTNQTFASSQILTELGPFFVATAPSHAVEGPGGTFGNVSFQVLDPLAFAYTNLVGGRTITLTNMDGSEYTVFVATNITRQGVFVGPDRNYEAEARFYPSSNPTNRMRTATIELSTASTNLVSGSVGSATLYLVDTLASEDARGVLINDLTSVTDPGLITARPANYLLSRLPVVEFAFGAQGNATITNTFFHDETFTNDVVTGPYAGYAADIDSLVSRPPPVPGGTVTNLSGRVTIICKESLNLEEARLQANGLLSIQTPHLLSSANAIIDAENLSFTFGSTNSMPLHVQNVAKEAVARMNGQIFAWSGVWSNLAAQVFTNNWVVGTNSAATNAPFTNFVSVNLHAFIVDASALIDIVPVQVHELLLTGTNVVMDDAARVVGEMRIDGESFTLNGSIRMEPDLTDWTAAIAPSLQHFTNNGTLYVANEAHFGDDTALPYVTFVNHGLIDAFGQTINADECLITGTNQTVAALTLESRSAKLDGGLFNVGGDLTLSGDVFRLKNSFLLVLGRLNLLVSTNGALADTGGGADNEIRCEDGFSMPLKPSTGDLLGTTVHSVSPTFALVNHTWAGTNSGPNPEGYSNNVAIGVLSLEPESIFSDFEFQGVGSITNGLYVDLLDLSLLPDYESRLFIAPNLIIYFAAAEGVPEEELDGALGGRLRWVKEFAGPNSSIEVLLTNGTTIVVNRALRESIQYDSDGDGLANGFDPFPFDGPVISQVGLSPSQPAHVGISWLAAAKTVYTVECSGTGEPGDWQPLVSVTNTAASSTWMTVQDPDPVGGAVRYYRVFYKP